jgi:hypothetical protein
MTAVELRMAPDPAHLHGNQEQERQRPATPLVPVHELQLTLEAEAEAGVTVGHRAPKHRHGERRLLRLVPAEQRDGDTHPAPPQVPLTPLPRVRAWLPLRLVR